MTSRLNRRDFLPLALGADCTNGGKVLLVALIHFMAVDGRDAGWAWPSRSVLAGFVGKSEGWVAKRLSELRGLGLVESRRTQFVWAHRVLLFRESRWDDVDELV